MSTLPGIAAQTPAEPRTRTGRDWRDVLYPLLVVAALAAAWQAANAAWRAAPLSGRAAAMA